MKNYTQTKKKLTYRTCTIFRVFQANERQSGRRIRATGKVARVASVSLCFRSKDEKRDFRREKNGTRCKRERGRGRKEVSFRSFTRAIFGTVLDSRSSLFSPKQHGNACYASFRERSGEKMTLFFFLLFTPLLGTRLSLAFARLKTRKKKEETNKRQAHPKNVGTEMELSLIPFRFLICFAINILGLPLKKNAKIIFIMRPFYLFYTLTKKYKTIVITTTVSSEQLYIKRGSPNFFLEFFISFFYILMSIFSGKKGNYH